jgi:molecular chaperone GrpE
VETVHGEIDTPVELDQSSAGPEPVPGHEQESRPEQEPVDGVVVALESVAEQLAANNARAQARERVIDWLHQELERLKRGEHAMLLRPVVTDLQHLRGDLLRQARTLPADVDRATMAELLESFALSVELALERCGSVPFRPAPGDLFAVREHRAVKQLPAQSPEQDGVICEVIADGYLDTSEPRVTVPARVHVLRWSGPAGQDTADRATERPDEPAHEQEEH